jgi:hypothetical protein
MDKSGVKMDKSGVEMDKSIFYPGSDLGFNTGLLIRTAGHNKVHGNSTLDIKDLFDYHNYLLF